VIKRVCEFEAYSSCWPDDQLKAKGLVSDIRKHVDIKDSFTRMQLEREAEHKAAKLKHTTDVQRVQERKALLGGITAALFALFSQVNAQARGKALEGVLNRLFAAYGILLKEDFAIRTESGNAIAEQIDGAIELDSQVYLVEMKWWKEPIGVPDVSAHLVRLFGRGGVRGAFISASGYTESAVGACRDALRDIPIILCDLSEIVRLLEVEADLKTVLKDKIHAALLDRNPFQRYIG
jgi:restriction system protein